MADIVFPTGFTQFQTPSRSMVVYADDGTRNGFMPVSAMLGLIVLNDMLAAIMSANDVVESVPAATTSYAVVAADKNKTKLFENTAICAVALPAGMPVGFLFDWVQWGTGILTFGTAAGAGQTVRNVSTEGFRSGGQYSRGTLEVMKPNEWLLTGFTQV